MVLKEIMRCPKCEDFLNPYSYRDANLGGALITGMKCCNCHYFIMDYEIAEQKKAKPVVVDRLKEEELVKKTADLWNEYIKLDNIDDCESLEIASAIHTIQGRLAIRMHQRDVKESPFIK